MSKNLRKAALVAALAIAATSFTAKPAQAATLRFHHHTASEASAMRVYPNASCVGSTYATVQRGYSVGGIGCAVAGKGYSLWVLKGLQPRWYKLSPSGTWSGSAGLHNYYYVGGQGLTVSGFAARVGSNWYAG